MGQMPKIILASTSPYRKELLERLGVKFSCAIPKYEEENPLGLKASELSIFHAENKARSLIKNHPKALIIGSDQVAEVGGSVIGKPGTVEGAIAQLTQMSGKRITFHTGLARAYGEAIKSVCVPFHVTLRELTPKEITNYVERERPLDCAGSFKIEGLGIALMEKLDGEDFTSLIGLPLIKLTSFLREAGVRIL
jgi:septum formation protein